MARVLLIHPPLTDRERFVRGSKASASFIPPLGLAYLAAYLQKHGHQCRIIDGLACPLSLEEICRIAREYDWVGITVVSSYALRAIELIRLLKRNCPDIPVVVGGPHVTVLPKTMLDEGADYAVIGEGEETLLELVEGRENVQGVALLIGGKIQLNRRPMIQDLNRVPLPARDLLPMHLYRSSIARSDRQPSHAMFTSRGCPGMCTFCSKATFGTQVRYFSVERIVEEFFLLRDKYGAKDIAVWDDNFVANNEIALAVCEELKRRKLGITWSVEARVDHVNQEVLTALKEAGCNYIAYGIESGSQRVLDYLNKKITKERIKETVAMTKRTGIPIRGYFILGLPTETLKEMEETVRFAMELDIDLASFTMFTPLPGTAEYFRALKTGSFSDPEYYLHTIIPEFNFPKTVLYTPEGMTASQLINFHRRAYNRYYFRPKILLKKILSIRSFDEVSAAFKGGLTLLTNMFSK